MKRKICTNLVIRHQKNPQHQIYPLPDRTYDTDVQKMKPLDTSPELPTERLKRIERIIGKLLYYTRGVDNTCLASLSTTETRNDPTEQDEKSIHQILY